MPVLKLAAVVHLFYNEQWQELATYLRNIRHEFSLFVTVPDFSQASGFVLSDFPAAQVVRVPNVGRDVAPFIRLLPDLQRFDVVCKIHTKRNIGTSDLWRKELQRGVLGSRQIVNLILRAFDSHPDMVLAGPKPLYLDGPTYMFGSRLLLEKYFGALRARFAFRRHHVLGAAVDACRFSEPFLYGRFRSP